MGTLHTSHVESEAPRAWDEAVGRPARDPSRPCASCGYPLAADGIDVTDDIGFCRQCVRDSHPGPQAEIGVVD